MTYLLTALVMIAFAGLLAAPTPALVPVRLRSK